MLLTILTLEFILLAMKMCSLLLRNKASKYCQSILPDYLRHRRRLSGKVGGGSCGAAKGSDAGGRSGKGGALASLQVECVLAQVDRALHLVPAHVLVRRACRLPVTEILEILQ
jgi:hypothetical protein